jgi:phosphoglycerol transferase MdoB-like AlkP superfamily enzyme
MAKILFVGVGKFNLRPERGQEEMILGSVAIEKTNIAKRLLIGAAPIIFGLIIILALLFWATGNEWASDWRAIAILGYLIFVVGNTMFSSKKDLEGVWKVVLFSVFVLGILYLLGVRITINIDLQVFRVASLYLIPAIAIDAGLLWAISLIRGR